MRNLLLLCLFTACELQPAPPKSSPSQTTAPAGSAATGSAGSDVDPTRLTAPHAVAPPPVQPTAECEQAGIRLADLMIAGADPSQKPAFEVDRANIIRRTETACTQQHWTPAALACIAQSSSDAQARACLEKFPSPTAVPQGGASAAGPGGGSAAGAGGGSAAGPRGGSAA
jgi:hypothetical protein